MAAGEGFEPSQTESESGVLPLHKPAVFRRTLSIIASSRKMSIAKRKFIQNIFIGRISCAVHCIMRWRAEQIRQDREFRRGQ